MNNLFITINYTDGDQSTYKGVEASIGKEKVIFNTENPTVDWINMYKWSADKDFFVCVLSSSVDHFITDGNKYKRIYIDHKNNHKFTNNENDLLYIVNKDINSFEQHLEYYKKHNNEKI